MFFSYSVKDQNARSCVRHFPEAYIWCGCELLWGDHDDRAINKKKTEKERELAILSLHYTALGVHF